VGVAPLLAVAGLLASGGTARPQALLGGCPQQFEVEPNGTAATASPIQLPDPTFGMFTGIKGAIDVPGDEDWYSFSAPAGARLSLSVDTGFASAANRDSVLTVFGPDGTTVLEEDDDDGTGNRLDTSIESLDASIVAGLVLPAAGTYFARVRAKTPADTLSGYVLLAAVISVAPEPESEPNDTSPGQVIFHAPILGSLSSAADVDWYMADILDFGIPFIVVDGDPERDGVGTDIVVHVDTHLPQGTIDTNSSGAGSPGDPPAEGLAFQGLGDVRVSGTGPGTYLIGVWYSGDGCPVPVELQSLQIH
jgi:Bacterial pre-peptidase C-terminal domain